jgi:NitT/TauT family transport system substrate-binding protein
MRCLTIPIVLACAALLWGCGKDSSSTPGSTGETKKVKLQLNWKPEPQFGGFYAGDVIDAYRKRSLNVEITPGGAGAPTVEMVGAGTVPFGIVSGDEIVLARAHGNKVVALFAVYQTNPQGIMTRKSRGFKTIADIFTHEGTVAMERGLPYSDFLKNKYGFDKVKVVPSPFGDLALYRSQENYAMQVFVTSEPIAARKTGIEPQTFLIAEAGYNPYTTVLATSESYLSSNRDTVNAMVDAAREGWEAYLKDPSRTNDVMAGINQTMDAQTFSEAAEAQKPLIETDETKKNGLGSMTTQRWKTLVDQLVELKVIDKPVPAEELFLPVKK